jgi:hypothetical protein
MLRLGQRINSPPERTDTVTILHHLPQTVKNNAAKAEAPVRGAHSIVNLLRHHYSVSGSWVSTLLVAAIAGILAAVAFFVCRTRQQRGGLFVGGVRAQVGVSWQASQFVTQPDRSYTLTTQHPRLRGLSLTWPAHPGGFPAVASARVS